MAAAAVAVDDLRRLDLFGRLSDERLTWLAEHAVEHRYDEGEALFEEGKAPEDFFVLLEGELEDTKRVGAEDVVLTRHQAVTFLGAIPLLNREAYPATSRALRPSRVAHFDSATFHTLVRSEPEVETELMRVFGPMYQRFEATMRQREKLAALGGLAAGLAHELNNPASAAKSAAGELRDALAALEDATARFGSAGGDVGAALGRLGELRREVAERSATAEPLDALDASEREEVLGEWLEARGVEEPWQLSAAFVEAGLDEQFLDRVEAAAGEAVGPALELIAAGLSARGLLDEIQDSTRRISDLVGAVKQYSYMDRASESEVDVHDGLESTVTMLAHKLKKGDVKLVREYDRSLPLLCAQGSELNQVWTNLIVNAIDAVGGDGTITLHTAREGESVLVEVIDDGPGIPEDIQPRVFEPFFTTKGVGEGSGLGLDVSHRIVHDRHRGDLSFKSRPGETRFQVRLPLRRGGQQGRPEGATPRNEDQNPPS